eukprot:363076-Chlamydomonas_euryale.AAC.10
MGGLACRLRGCAWVGLGAIEGLAAHMWARAGKVWEGAQRGAQVAPKESDKQPPGWCDASCEQPAPTCTCQRRRRSPHRPSRPAKVGRGGRGGKT